MDKDKGDDHHNCHSPLCNGLPLLHHPSPSSSVSSTSWYFAIPSFLPLVTLYILSASLFISENSKNSIGLGMSAVYTHSCKEISSVKRFQYERQSGLVPLCKAFPVERTIRSKLIWSHLYEPDHGIFIVNFWLLWKISTVWVIQTSVAFVRMGTSGTDVALTVLGILGMCHD